MSIDVESLDVTAPVLDQAEPELLLGLALVAHADEIVVDRSFGRSLELHVGEVAVLIERAALIVTDRSASKWHAKMVLCVLQASFWWTCWWRKVRRVSSFRKISDFASKSHSWSPRVADFAPVRWCGDRRILSRDPKEGKPYL